MAKTVRKRPGPFQGKPLKLNNEHTLSEPPSCTDIGTDTSEPALILSLYFTTCWRFEGGFLLAHLDV
jgi:hypothetical protein